MSEWFIAKIDGAEYIGVETADGSAFVTCDGRAIETDGRDYSILRRANAEEVGFAEKSWARVCDQI